MDPDEADVLRALAERDFIETWSLFASLPGAAVVDEGGVLRLVTGAADMTRTAAGSRPALSAESRTWPTIHAMRSGSAIWSMIPSAIRPASSSALGP